MIADSSALLWAVLDAAHDPEALRTLARAMEGSPWRSPSLAPYEVGNALHRKQRTRMGGSVEYRLSAAARARSFTRIATPSALSWEWVGALAERAGISFYDAAYLSLARETMEGLVTADGGMAAHAEALGITTYLLPRDLEKLARTYPGTT